MKLIVIDEKNYRAHILNDEGVLISSEIDFTEDYNQEKVGGWIIHNDVGDRAWEEHNPRFIPNYERIMKLLTTK
tara:strand:+ start:1736 stop:1957 length:222 start_codon:yes stop_codon:yes gene_type:complete